MILEEFMETHSPLTQQPNLKLSLVDQLREMYGRVAYTQKAHEKMADDFVSNYKKIKLVEIVISALASGSFLISIFGDSYAGTVIGSLLSTVLLGFILYFKEASLGELAQKHSETASKLWGYRERLLGLLVDLNDGMSHDQVREYRDELNAELELVYRSAPRTNVKAYKAAQNALKNAEELYFSDDELDNLLPKVLRRGSE